MTQTKPTHTNTNPATSNPQNAITTSHPPSKTHLSILDFTAATLYILLILCLVAMLYILLIFCLVVMLYILLTLCLLAFTVLCIDWIAKKISENPGRWEVHQGKYFRLMYLLVLSVLMAIKILWVVESVLMAIKMLWVVEYMWAKLGIL